MSDQIDISPEAVTLLAAMADTDTIRWPAVRDTLLDLSRALEAANEGLTAAYLAGVAEEKARQDEALATARTDALEEAARRIEETMKEAIRENGPVKSLTDKAVIEMLEAIVSGIRALKDQTPAEVTVQDARIPDHAAWAARGRWREAYEALRALADEGRT